MWCPPVLQRVTQPIMQQVSQPVMSHKLRRLVLWSTILLCSAGGMAGREATAQPLAACEPPRANEYLLLVLNQKADTPDQLRQLLPANAEITPCNYLNENVVRVSGFATADIANAWAQYVADMAGLQAFVARPAGDTTAAAPTGSTSAGSGTAGTGFPTPTQIPASGGTSTPSPTQTAQGTTSGGATSFPTPTQPTATPTVAPSSSASPSSSTATPQPLGAGYAVLVRYFNRPEVAADVHQVTSQPVGLVAYEQFPFLLAAYTTDANAAATILKTLNDRGFTAFIVDSRRAILLTPAVVGTEGRQG